MSTTQDFSKRIAIVVMKNLEGWQATNIVAHISAYIGNRLSDGFGTGEFFVTSDSVQLPRNSQYPIIIKEADSTEMLQEAFDSVRQAGLLHLGFIREMIDSGDDSEIETALRNKSYKDIELLGFGVFGENEQVKSLTKKFSLWK